MTGEEDEIVRAMTSGEATGEKLRMVETHAARVFLGAERAYKVKRPVRYSYLDFSTFAARLAALEREVELNRRTAPEMYLGTGRISRMPDGRLSMLGRGDEVEPVLVMRRFADGALYSERLESGALTRADIEALAEAVAAFHSGAEVFRDRGGAAAMRAIVEENAAELEQIPDLAAGSVRSFNVLSRMAVKDGFSPALDRRRDDGFVRRCHGDLHLGNVFDDGGVPRLFDCIEFNDDLAIIDVLYDLAFLLMDLIAAGRPDLANAALNRYLVSAPREEWPANSAALPLMLLFTPQRAAIRAHVAARAGRADECRRYFALAQELVQVPRPRLIAVGGLSGSGKSALARALAPGLANQGGALILRSDEIRKRIRGARFNERLPQSAYAREVSAEVYAAMYDLAFHALQSGWPVILDAVFAGPEERRRAEETAMGVYPFHGLWMDAPREVLLGRVRARTDDASDADARVVEQQLGYDLGRIGWHRLDATKATPELLADAGRAIGQN